MDEARAVAVLQMMGIPPSDTDVDQMMVMLSAFDIFRQRNERYQDLWREGGYDDSANSLKHKVMRVVQETRTTEGEPQIDDALDIINYACFWIRNVNDGNRGNW